MINEPNQPEASFLEMRYENEIKRLELFLKEIEQYYARSKNEQGSLLILSRAMVAFALNHLDENELNQLLLHLKAGGQLISGDQDKLVFRKFYRNDQNN